MGIYCKGVARIRHQKTKRIYTISSQDLSWECVETDERKMGPEHHHEALFEHDELGTISWHIWEYPTGVESLLKTNANGHEVIEDLDYGLSS